MSPGDVSGKGEGGDSSKIAENSRFRERECEFSRL